MICIFKSDELIFVRLFQYLIKGVENMKSFFVVIVFSFFLFLLTGCLEELPVNMPTVFNMSIDILNPKDKATVPDTTTIRIAIDANKGFNTVRLYIDSLLRQQYYLPMRESKYFWDVRNSADGTRHVIYAQAVDNNGKVYTSAKKTVLVYRFMPSELTAEIKSDTTVQLNWKDNCNYETGFEIELAVNDADFVKVAEADSSVTQKIIKGNFNLEDSFYFRVRAKSAKGYSGYSNVSKVNAPLNHPLEFTVQLLGDSAAVLTWKDDCVIEDGYRIEMSTNPSYMLSTIKTVPANSVSDTIYYSFQNNTEYYFRVCAYKGVKMSDYITYPGIKFTIKPPWDINMEELSANSIKLTWKDNCTFVKGYKIERRVNSGNWDSVLISSGNKEFIDNVDTSLIYEYRVSIVTKNTGSLASPLVKLVYTLEITKINNVHLAGYINGFCMYDNKTKIAAGVRLNGFTVQLFDAVSGNLIKSLPPMDSILYYNNPGVMAVSENGKYAAAIWSTKRLFIWDCETGDTLLNLYLGGNIPAKMDFTKDGKYLIFPIGNVLYVLSMSSLTYVNEIFTNRHVTELSLSNDGDYLVCNGSNSSLEIRAIPSGNIVKTLSGSDNATSAFFSKDGQYVYGINSNNIVTYDVNTGSIIKSIPCGNSNGVFDISPSGEYFAVPRGTAIDLYSNEKSIKLASVYDDDYSEKVIFSNTDNSFYASQTTDWGRWQIENFRWKKY